MRSFLLDAFKMFSNQGYTLKDIYDLHLKDIEFYVEFNKGEKEKRANEVQPIDKAFPFLFA